MIYESKFADVSKWMILPGVLGAFVASSAWSTEVAGAVIPEFRKHATNEQIVAAMEDAKVAAKIADFDAGNGVFPECGGYVDVWTDGSPFSKLGIPEGSVIQRHSAKRYLSCPPVLMMDAAALGDELEKIVWVNHENERRESVVAQGPLGYQFRFYRNLPNWYLRHGRRGAKWDPYVLAALDQQGKDPALSESCWAEAFAQGYVHDKLSAWSGMLLALDRREIERAAAYAGRFVPFEPCLDPSDFPIAHSDIYKMALIGGDPKWFEEVSDVLRSDVSYGPHLPNFRHQIELAANVPAGTPPPSELAKGMKCESFLMDADTSPRRGSKNLQKGVLLHEQAVMAHLKGEKEMPEHRFETDLAKYANYFFSPAQVSRDVDVEIRFRAQPMPAPRDQIHGFHRTFYFGLVDRKVGKVRDIGPSPDTRILLTNLLFSTNDSGEYPSWEIGCNGKVARPLLPVWQGIGRNPSPLLIPISVPYPYDPDHVHTLRIVRVGPQAEALLDGRRLALVHVPLELNNPGVYFKVVGCRITVTSLKADILK